MISRLRELGLKPDSRLTKPLTKRAPNERPFFAGTPVPAAPIRVSVRHDVLATTPYFATTTGNSNPGDWQIVNCVYQELQFTSLALRRPQRVVQTHQSFVDCQRD
jgi:hypothetical protein